MDATGVITKDGSWWLRDYEKRLIEAAIKTLDSEEQNIIRKQLRNPFYIQRIHRDRMNDIFFYVPERAPKLVKPAEFQVAKLRLKSGRRRVNVSIKTFEGYIRALRFYKDPREIVREEFSIEVLEVGGTNDDSIARELDREEHGDEYYPD